MGVAAADVAGRLAASVGELDAVAPDFTPALDVPNGGLLWALPALIAVGLLEGVERYLQLPKGYYGLDSLLLLLAFMALARLESIESLRYSAPGEWGNLLGLDRVPEVRTLRAKIRLLAREDAPGQWSAALCERWMGAAPEQAGVLYIDGHVRVYNGGQTRLPRVISLIISPPFSEIILWSKGGDFSDCEARWCSLGRDEECGKTGRERRGCFHAVGGEEGW